MQFTGEKPWDPVTLDAYPSAKETNTATLYEDDTLTPAYQHGAFRTTEITASMDDTQKTVRVDIGAAKGTFHGELKRRSWVLRIRRPANWPADLQPTQIKINGRPMAILDSPIRRLARTANAMPFGDLAGAPDGDVYEITLPAAPVSRRQVVEVTYMSP